MMQMFGMITDQMIWNYANFRDAIRIFPDKLFNRKRTNASAFVFDTSNMVLANDNKCIASYKRMFVFIQLYK